MDNNGTLYYSLLTTNSIAKWNTQLSFQSGQLVIARDGNFLEWPNSFTFDQNGNITVLVNKLNRFIYDKLNLNQANFRLITSRVGGKSYLYDQTYNYNTGSNKETTALPVTEDNATVSSDLAAPELYIPGSDQDPYLAPHPVPKPSTPEPIPEPEPEPEPEPTAEPTPEPTPKNMDHDHMNHDHMGHDHMDHDHMNHSHMNHNHVSQADVSPSQEEPKGGSPKVVATFMGILVATTLIFV